MKRDLQLFILILAFGIVGIGSCITFLVNRNYSFLFFGVIMLVLVYITLLAIIITRRKG